MAERDAGEQGAEGTEAGDPAGGPIMRRYLKLPMYARITIQTFTTVATILAVPLAVQSATKVKGPGWAILLAAAAVVTIYVLVAGVYIQEDRHAKALSHQRRNHGKKLAQIDRRARVGAALPHVHKAFHELRNAAVRMRSGDSAAATDESMVHALAALAAAFTQITGEACRVCVKKLEAKADAPDEVTFDESNDHWFTVRTLWRHDGSYTPAKDAAEPLARNSDFRAIWSEKQTDGFFYANDLDNVPPQFRPYINDHRIPNQPDDNDYNAAIVWPIQRAKNPTRVGLLGFLCLDTKVTNVLDVPSDFELGAAFADTLYTALSQRQEQARQPSDGHPVPEVPNAAPPAVAGQTPSQENPSHG